jgi:hypothetical protein
MHCALFWHPPWATRIYFTHWKGKLMTQLTHQESANLWAWLSLQGFTRTHPPKDAELVRLSAIAERECQPWATRLFLREAIQETLQEAL